MSNWKFPFVFIFAVQFLCAVVCERGAVVFGARGLWGSVWFCVFMGCLLCATGKNGLIVDKGVLFHYRKHARE